MKKVMVLLCLLALALLPAALSEGWLYELTGQGLVIKGYEGSATTLEIPESIDGYRVTAIAREAFADDAEVRRLVIPEGVSAIGAEAFRGCIGLSEVEFNAKNCTVPEVWIYGGDKNEGVFSGAGSASPNGLTVVFGDAVAEIPTNLFDTASIGEYGHDGAPCAFVTAVEMGRGVKRVGQYAFRGCRELETVSFGTSLQSIAPHAFDGCTALNELRFNDALTTIEAGAFSGDAGLTAVAFGMNLGSIGDGAFENCVALEELELVKPLSAIGVGAFQGCLALKKLTIPESLTSLGANAFYGCACLSEIAFNAKRCDVPPVWIYGGDANFGAFSGAGFASPTGLTVTFGDSVAEIPDHLFDTASSDEYGHDGHAFACVTAVATGNSSARVGQYAFRGCRELTEVGFGAAVQSIAPYAFDTCTALNELRFDDALVTIEEGAFRGDTGLTAVVFGTNLGSIGSVAFEGCVALNALELVSPLASVGSGAFKDCLALRKLVVPESLTSLGANAFYGCVNLAEIAFNAQNCAVPAVWIYGSDANFGAFSGAGSASPIGMKAVFGDAVAEVPANLFDTASTDTYGHDGYDFAYLTEALLRPGVGGIGSRAFAGCQRLGVVFIQGTCEIAEDAFDGCTDKGFRLERGGGEPEPAQEPSEAGKEAAPDVDAPETWTCENGHEGNTGNFCPQCGAARPTVKVCPACGETFPEGSQYRFCPGCGAKLT